MNLQDVRDAVAEIQMLAKDERNVEAHEKEDEMFRSVLASIADDQTLSSLANMMAAIAMQSPAIQFDRWYE